MPNTSNIRSLLGKIGMQYHVEWFPCLMHPYDLVTDPFLVKQLFLLFMIAFCFSLLLRLSLHQDTLLSFSKKSFFVHYNFSELSERQLHHHLQIFPVFVFGFFSADFSNFLLFLSDFFCHRVSSFSTLASLLSQCNPVTWKVHFHLIKLHN